MNEAGQRHPTAEAAARSSYGRLVSLIAARTADISAAEDALSAAFESALRTWPTAGVPDRPEAWLLTAARRTLIDEHRRHTTTQAAVGELAMLAEERGSVVLDGARFPDDRLKLLFVCAHPAIDRAIRTPLMLQTVLGLSADRIAAAFLVSPRAMRQRLVRAKAKIRDAAIPFAVPGRSDMSERLPPVLDAIYVAFGTGWDDAFGADREIVGLADEAIFLARLTNQLLPNEAELKGLLALCLYAEARRGARRDDEGRYVPLSEQDVSRWRRDLIEEAEAILLDAAELERTGRFQFEAAIQSAHVQGRLCGMVNWSALVILYSKLLEIAPSLGAHVSLAAATASAGQTDRALSILDRVAAGAHDYQPFWAVRAHVLADLGQTSAAHASFDRAAALSADPAVKRFLSERRDALT